MPRSFLQLEGFIHARSPAAVQAFSSAIGAAGGWILRAQAFSNIALSFSFEVPARRVGELSGCLERADIKLYEGFGRAIDEAALQQGDSDGEVPGMMMLTLIHDQPDEPGFLPPVPG